MLNKMLNSGVTIDIVIGFIVSLFYQIKTKTNHHDNNTI